jgi:hypothetical protein
MGESRIIGSVPTTYRLPSKDAHGLRKRRSDHFPPMITRSTLSFFHRRVTLESYRPSQRLQTLLLRD